MTIINKLAQYLDGSGASPVGDDHLSVHNEQLMPAVNALTDAFRSKTFYMNPGNRTYYQFTVPGSGPVVCQVWENGTLVHPKIVRGTGWVRVYWQGGIDDLKNDITTKYTVLAIGKP